MSSRITQLRSRIIVCHNVISGRFPNQWVKYTYKYMSKINCIFVKPLKSGSDFLDFRSLKDFGSLKPLLKRATINFAHLLIHTFKLLPLIYVKRNRYTHRSLNQKI